MNMLRTSLGMEPLAAAVRQDGDHARQYRRLGLQPGHFIVELDAGNGHTTAAAYLSESYAQAGVRRFGGLDQMLEYHLDGSMEQLRQTLRSIRANAVYANHFEGVIAWDVTVLATHPGEDQTRLFLSSLPEMAKYATMLFFLPSSPGCSQLLLMEKVCVLLGPEQVRRIRIPPYPEHILAGIVRQTLTGHLGVRLENEPECRAALQEMVRQCGIRNAGQAVQLARQADFTGFAPTLDLTRSAQLVRWPEGSSKKKEEM